MLGLTPEGIEMLGQGFAAASCVVIIADPSPHNHWMFVCCWCCSLCPLSPSPPPPSSSSSSSSIFVVVEVENHLGRKCPFLGCLLLEICKKIYTENSTENWRASIKIDWQFGLCVWPGNSQQNFQYRFFKISRSNYPNFVLDDSLLLSIHTCTVAAASNTGLTVAFLIGYDSWTIHLLSKHSFAQHARAHDQS